MAEALCREVARFRAVELPPGLGGVGVTIPPEWKRCVKEGRLPVGLLTAGDGVSSWGMDQPAKTPVHAEVGGLPRRLLTEEVDRYVAALAALLKDAGFTSWTVAKPFEPCENTPDSGAVAFAVKYCRLYVSEADYPPALGLYRSNRARQECSRTARMAWPLSMM